MSGELDGSYKTISTQIIYITHGFFFFDLKLSLLDWAPQKKRPNLGGCQMIPKQQSFWSAMEFLVE